MGEKGSRKLFFGLFIFPLLIALGMAVLLCSVVLLTNERETPETLITAIKTGSPSKRWQKAFELSNELNQSSPSLRSESLMRESIHILKDSSHYDSKTRGYMALALGRFEHPDAVAALEKALEDDNEDVRLYSLWALGTLRATDAVPAIRPFLKSESEAERKMAVYVLGAMGDTASLPSIRPLLEDPIEDIRWNAALSLARLGDESGSEILAQMLDRESLSLDARRSEEDIEKIMINAAKGLALIHRPDSIKILKSLSSTDKNMKVRQAALDAIRYQNENASDKIKR